MKLFDKLFKKEKTNQIKAGDWVNSYSKGIYRIENIIEQFYDESSVAIGENKIGDKIKDRIIVSKRFLNSKFKKSISYESCSECYITKLNENQQLELQKAIEKNPNMLMELDEYEIPTRKTIYNMDLKIEKEADLSKVIELIEFVKTGKTFLEIQLEMERVDIMKLKPKHFGNHLFQLINYNDEFLDRKKIWRNANLIKNNCS